VNEYFDGAIRQLQARARHLISLILRNLERDVDTLAVRCRDQIDAVIARLEILFLPPRCANPRIKEYECGDSDVHSMSLTFWRA
jgi:hypothetical protein